MIEIYLHDSKNIYFLPQDLFTLKRLILALTPFNLSVCHSHILSFPSFPSHNHIE